MLIAAPSPPPTGPKVLLVEDDGELRSLIATSLRGSGFEVTEASDGDDFINRLAEAKVEADTGPAFDLILSDIQMPAFSALDVLVGAHALLRQTPVVLMTAFGDRGTHERALLRGATVVLDKPVRLSELHETVQRVLRQAQ